MPKRTRYQHQQHKRLEAPPVPRPRLLVVACYSGIRSVHIRAKHGAKQAACVGFHCEQCPTVRAGVTRVETGVALLLQQVSLEDAEELFCLGEGSPEMLNALVVFVESDHVGDSLFLTLIVAQNELEFDTHGEAPPGEMGG